MSKKVFILGGCRSGKSRFALEYGRKLGKKRLFIATAEAKDEEMLERINTHKRLRGDDWVTIEEPTEIAHMIKKHQQTFEIILIDCLTLWLANLLDKEEERNQINQSIEGLIATIENARTNIILVSNEVGLGIIPINPLAREFRDLMGFVNQKIAAVADEVFFTVAGIPTQIKK